MQVSDDDDDDEFDASRYTASFGVEAGSDDDDGGDAVDGAATRPLTEPRPATELPPVPIEEEDGPGASGASTQPKSSQPAETASDPYFGPAASSSANSIVAAASQKQAEIAVVAASQAVSGTAVQEAPVEYNTARRNAAVSDDEEENRTPSAAPAAAKARGKKGRATPKGAQARRQQESAPVQAAAVVDTTFLETLNVAVKNKRQKDTGLQLCDFKKLLTRWTPSRLEFELPSNITREAAPWAVECGDGRLRIPPVPMNFDVFYTYGLRKEADDIIQNAKDNDVDLLRHCAAATITCFRTEENNTYSTIAFLRVALVEPNADADSEVAEAWTSFRDRACRESDGLCKYEILVVLNSTAFGILKNDREVTGMFFAESVHAVAQKGGRGSTANHYNQNFATFLQDCEFDDDFCILAKSTKTGKKRAASSKGSGSNESNKQKKSSSQPTIMAAIGREASVAQVEPSEGDESEEDEAEKADGDGGAVTSSTAMVVSTDRQVAAPMDEDGGARDFNSERVNAGVYLLGPESNVTTFVRNGNVYATVFA